MRPASTKSSSQQSLLEYLQQKNPIINNARCRTGKNTKTTLASWVTPRHFELWEDFELNSLKSMYGGALQSILQEKYELQDHSAIPEFPFCEIHDENSLETLIIKWNYSVVSGALAAGQQRLQRYRDWEQIYMVRGGQANYPGSDSKHRTDWAGIHRSHSPRWARPTNILPGDTKLSCKWTSEPIEYGAAEDSTTPENWFGPLKQVYTYCLRANVRYGYILTDKELVVLRIRPGPQDRSLSAKDKKNPSKISTADAAQKTKRSGVVEYRSIPWVENNSDVGATPDGMTVNLALWWLHLLAADAKEIEDLYSPLNSVSDQFASFSSDTSILAKQFSDTMPTLKGRREEPSPLSQRNNRKRSRDAHVNADRRKKRSRGGDGKRYGGRQ